MQGKAWSSTAMKGATQRAWSLMVCKELTFNSKKWLTVTSPWATHQSFADINNIIAGEWELLIGMFQESRHLRKQIAFVTETFCFLLTTVTIWQASTLYCFLSKWIFGKWFRIKYAWNVLLHFLKESDQNTKSPCQQKVLFKTSIHSLKQIVLLIKRYLNMKTRYIHCLQLSYLYTFKNKLLNN